MLKGMVNKGVSRSVRCISDRPRGGHRLGKILAKDVALEKRNFSVNPALGIGIYSTNCCRRDKLIVHSALGLGQSHRNPDVLNSCVVRRPRNF